MTIPLFRIIGTLAVVTVTTATTTAVASQRVDPGVPKDFPMAPGLTPCKPTTGNHLVMCKWHGVNNGHAVFAFYRDALPKAGYTLPEGTKETTTPKYDGELAFAKGDVKGAMVITGSDVEIDFFIS